ncbi:MAG: hypothetical protein ACRDHW_04415 [Ktedonobacteraceae bacterium]
MCYLSMSATLQDHRVDCWPSVDVQLLLQAIHEEVNSMLIVSSRKAQRARRTLTGRSAN